MTSRPDCYTCRHRGSVPGSAHSCCNHPLSREGTAPESSLLAVFASVGRINPVVNISGAIKLGIKANRYGIARGWFNWPYNFDPNWLLECNGYEETR